MKTTRRHRVLDHPIAGYFILAVFGVIALSIFVWVDSWMPWGLDTSGLFAAAGSLLALLLFKIWFRPDYKGCLTIKTLLTGLIMLLPVLILHYVGSIASIISFGSGSVLLAFLNALTPGFGEEVIFRGMGIANFMRTIRSEKQIKVIFWISSIVFGFAHMANAIGGGDPRLMLIQSIYAIGIGMAFGAVYLRTGNLLATIIAHFSLDFLEMIRADLTQSGGIMIQMGAGDWITVAAGLLGAVIGLRLIRKQYHPQIMQVWKEKWSL
ncbi:MAG: CPBP family intramembrane metalloprotease [Firmicutes bacterium]|nr:CPBP family intramembrane metalloprotease [Bacillota bacterium]